VMGWGEEYKNIISFESFYQDDESNEEKKKKK